MMDIHLKQALNSLYAIAVHGNEYADNEGLDAGKLYSILYAALTETADEYDMMTDVCSAIRAIADAYGGDSHFNNCCLVAMRALLSALEGLNK